MKTKVGDFQYEPAVHDAVARLQVPVGSDLTRVNVSHTLNILHTLYDNMYFIQCCHVMNLGDVVHQTTSKHGIQLDLVVLQNVLLLN